MRFSPNALPTLPLKLMLAVVVTIAMTEAAGFEACGPIENAYGPFDYRTEHDKLVIVERVHFDSGVENLQRGNTSYLGGDIDYTLRASPNHARALMAITRLAQREKTDQPGGAHYTVACYFDRAVRFAPDDPTVRTLFAIYLNKKGRQTDAITQLQEAEKHAGDSPNIAYNLGLVYLDLGDFDEALRYAHIAYRAGFPLPGLRDRLKRAGKWREASP